ncbi:MAG: FadR family transcriptional regulator [Blastococcus sp.]|jgi:GntR family transcriptional repressor for pyruvate dehydrogenase complex|nr:FadR family transcriptional regulator [Blastococcus sp.]
MSDMSEMSELPEFGRSAPDDIASLIRAQINGGQLSPGDRLPNERELAVQLGVARLTLRQALRLLIGEGYLSSKRGNSGGTFVTDLSQPHLVWLERVRRHPEWAVDLIEFRKAVEERAAVLAASRATDEQLQAMRVSVAEAAEPASRGVFRQADHRFHATVAEASGSPRLLAAVVQARGELFVPVDAIQYRDRFTQTCEEHAAILDAIQRHDAAAAAAAMEAHLESSLRDLLDMVAQLPHPGQT